MVMMAIIKIKTGGNNTGSYEEYDDHDDLDADDFCLKRTRFSIFFCDPVYCALKTLGHWNAEKNAGAELCLQQDLCHTGTCFGPQ